MQNQSNPKILKLILWGAFFMTNFIYIGLMTIMPSGVETGLPTDVLLILGIVFVGISFFISRFIEPDPAVPHSELVPFIITLAVNETASILAFVIGFIGHDLQRAYLLFAISIIGFVFKFPQDAIRSMSQAKKDRKLDL